MKSIITSTLKLLFLASAGLFLIQTVWADENFDNLDEIDRFDITYFDTTFEDLEEIDNFEIPSSQPQESSSLHPDDMAVLEAEAEFNAAIQEVKNADQNSASNTAPATSPATSDEFVAGIENIGKQIDQLSTDVDEGRISPDHAKILAPVYEQILVEKIAGNHDVRQELIEYFGGQNK